MALAVVVLVLLLGLAADWLGHRLVLKNPVAAVRMLDWWVLVPGALAAAAAGASVVLAVELTVPDGTDPETKELVGTLATGITSFLSTGFVAWAGDENDSRLANRIKASFLDAYEGRFRPGSPGQLWVFADPHGGARGWGRPDRLLRAKGIAEELKSANSYPQRRDGTTPSPPDTDSSRRDP